MDVQKKDKMINDQDQHADDVSVASTGAASRASRRNQRRDKLRHVHHSYASQNSDAGPSGMQGVELSGLQPSDDSGVSHVGVQCDFQEEERSEQYLKLKKKYDKLKLELITLKGELSAVRRITGIEESDDALENDSIDSEMSSAHGFSDYGNGGGVGTK